ncbi:MAG: hypothetical protein K4571_05840 [Deltaproteobacteria bacterium]
MLKKQKVISHLLFLWIGICLLSCVSGGGKKTVAMDREQTPREALLKESIYRKAVIHHFLADENLSRKYPDAAALCENTAFHELLRIGSIPMIVKTASSSLQEADTIIVKVRLAFVREPRLDRDKAKAGLAKMTAMVRLIDASTGKTIHEKNISLTDQPAVSSTDQSSQLGIQIARHISQVVRSQ